MNDLIPKLNDIKKDLGTLSDHVHGAAYMVNRNSPHHEFLKYLERVLVDMHDQIGFELNNLKEKPWPLNCS